MESDFTIEDLRKKFGSKMETVERWLTENGRALTYTVDADGEISCVVRGENDEYAVVISPDGVVSCSCMGFKTHKKLCKHILFVCLYAWIKGNLSLGKMKNLLGVV